MGKHGLLVGVLLAAVPLSSATTSLAADSAPRVDPAYQQYQPPYPPGAQTSGEQGAVVLEVLVRTNGRPMKARIAQSSGYSDLDTAAMQGVLNWRFIPATHDGETVTDWTTVRIVFNLPALVPAPAATQPPAS